MIYTLVGQNGRRNVLGLSECHLSVQISEWMLVNRGLGEILPMGKILSRSY